MNRRPLVVLTGPTAVGKTDLSIKLCKAINGAVISADSMQVYKHMDIGSAKVTKEEMQGVKHYLIDCLEPSEEFSIVEFQKMAKDALEEIYSNGQIPVIAGGTGFYIQALLYDIEFVTEDGTLEARKKWEEFYHKFGAHELHEQLKGIDAASYEAIHENNVKRVIRALEYYDINKSPISLHNETEKQKNSPYNFVYFVLNDDREYLYSRIDKRVDIMLENGLLDEVKALKDMGYTRDMTSMQGIGYKEILDYYNGDISLEEAIYIIKRDSRHYAKRQLTWFKREKEITWINKNEFHRNDDLILDYMINILKDKKIYE